MASILGSTVQMKLVTSSRSFFEIATKSNAEIFEPEFWIWLIGIAKQHKGYFKLDVLLNAFFKPSGKLYYPFVKYVNLKLQSLSALNTN